MGGGEVIISGSVRTKAGVIAQASECLRLKVLGWRDVDIADHLGINRMTVAKRVRQAIEAQGQHDVKAYREIISQRYEVLIRAAMEKYADTEDVVYLQEAHKVTASYERLVGATAPQQVDVTVTEVTVQERQIAEFVAQAERDRLAREAGPSAGDTRNEDEEVQPTHEG